MSIDSESDDSVAKSLKFQTRLGEGREGFLAHLLMKGLECGDRTSEDFLRCFPARAIMKALETRPIERARILVATTGVHEKIALKQSADVSGEMLEIALKEKVTDPTAILKEFQNDDRVQYLERKDLWAYATESQFWTKTAKDKDDFGRSQTMVAFILDAAIANMLTDHAKIVSALTLAQLAKDLPKDVLGNVIQAALAYQGKFDEIQFLGHVPSETLVKHVSLAYIWETVVVALVVKALAPVVEIVEMKQVTPMDDKGSEPIPDDVAHDPTTAADSKDPTKSPAWYDSLPKNEKPAPEKPASEPPPSIEVSVGSLAPPKA